MGISEICRDGVRVSLVLEDARLYLQIGLVEPAGDSRPHRMPCDPDVLCAVLRGMTYQVVSREANIILRRSGSEIILEFGTDSERHRCEMSRDDFAKVIAPVMPTRLRAMLL